MQEVVNSIQKFDEVGVYRFKYSSTEFLGELVFRGEPCRELVDKLIFHNELGSVCNRCIIKAIQ